MNMSSKRKSPPSGKRVPLWLVALQIIVFITILARTCTEVVIFQHKDSADSVDKDASANDSRSTWASPFKHEFISRSLKTAPPFTDQFPPSTRVECPFTQDTFYACLSTNVSAADSDACLACTNYAVALASNTSCSAFADSFCKYFSEGCSTCSNCVASLEAQIQCQLGNCTIDCEKSGTGSPISLTPVPSPSPSRSLTPDCIGEESAYISCLSNLTSAEVVLCMSCGRSLFQSASYTSCIALEDSVCPDWASCIDCGSCLNELRSYAECEVGCVFDCAVPTALPTSRCSSNATKYKACVEAQVNETAAVSCLACVDQALAQADTTKCESYNSSFCSSLSNCSPCGVCLPFVEHYADCLVGDCAVACYGEDIASRPHASTLRPSQQPSTPTPAALCSSKDIALQTCLNTSLTESDAAACASCANDAYYSASFDSCASFVDSFCSNSDHCTVCGSCLAIWVELVNCQFNQGSCSVICADSPTAAAVVTAATNAPTELQQDSFLSAARCPDELSAFDACVADKGLSSAEQISCLDCADRALVSSTLDSCASFVGSFCPAFGACTDCGICASLFGAYYICAVMGPDCSGDCNIENGARRLSRSLSSGGLRV